MTTYNRVTFLKKTLETWQKTRNPSYKWIIIIADDGSTDGSLDFLLSLKQPFLLLQHNRQRVHYQTNRLLKTASNLKFDVGFKTDDDLIFKKKGWDTTYIKAIKATGYDHLVFHDEKWRRKQHRMKTVSDTSGYLENKTHWSDTQGAFWTFTPRVLKSVGYFDLGLFGRQGWGHRDFTIRCCKAGFNDEANIFDVKNSNNWLQLNQENYVSMSTIGKPTKIDEETIRKRACLWDSRIFIPYNTAPFRKRYL